MERIKLKPIVWQIIIGLICIGLSLGTAILGISLRRNDIYYASMLYIFTFIFLVLTLATLYSIIGNARKSTKSSYKGDLSEQFVKWDQKQKIDT